MPDAEPVPTSSEPTDLTLLIKLAAALTGISEAKLASAIDPAQIIDAWYDRFGHWSDEPLQLADFIA